MEPYPLLRHVDTSLPSTGSSDYYYYFYYYWHSPYIP